MIKNRTNPFARALLCSACLFGAAGAASAITVEVVVSDDIQVNKNGGEDGASGGGSTQLNTRVNQNDRNEVFLMRFDLTGVNRSSINTAELQITNFRGRSQSPVKFYGVNNGVRGYNAVSGMDGPFTDNDWGDVSNRPTFSTAPGLEYDGDVMTPGVALEKVTDLGPTPTQPEGEGDILALATSEFKDFLVNHPDDIVTIIVTADSTSNGQQRYASREATALEAGVEVPEGTYAPRIVLDVIPVPNLSVSPQEAYLGDSLSFSWFAPIGSTNLLLTPAGEAPIDVSGDTDENGLGSLSLDAPPEEKTYTFSYDFEGNPNSFEQTVTILPPFLEVSPLSAVANETELEFTWRIKPNADLITLEVASSAEGPFVEVDDVTFDTVLDTGAGNYFYIPFPGETHFRITYEVEAVAQDPVTTSIELSEEIFSNIVASGTVGDPVVIPQILDNVNIYQDRSFTWDNIPQQLEGAQFLSPYNDDKNTAGISTEVTAAKDATFFMIVDNRVGNGENIDPPPASPILGEGVMDWAVAAGFADSGLDIEGAPGLFYSIYFKQVSAAESVTFLDQADGDTRVLYIVAAVSPQVSGFANFTASSLVINEGQTTTLNWLVPPGSTVSIDQGVGPVTDDTDATTGIGSKEVTPTATGDIPYTLTYDPPGDDPEATLGPLVVTVNSTANPGDFAITSINYSAQEGVSFSWPAPEGVTDLGSLTDTVERSTSLANDWGSILGAVITISEGVVTCTDPTPPAPRAFYRVNRP